MLSAKFLAKSIAILTTLVSKKVIYQSKEYCWANNTKHQNYWENLSYTHAR